MIAAELANLPGVRSAEPASDADGEGWWLFPRGDHAILPRSASWWARGWPVTALRAERGRLDDVFRAITMPDAPDAEALREAARRARGRTLRASRRGLRPFLSMR